jgi:hypothetical protein
MPVTKSEMMYFAAGAALGAAAGANLPGLKEKFGPLIAKAWAAASAAAETSYAEVARTVVEKVESMQDAVAEMNRTAAAAAETAEASSV